jgi:hypothetical protein
VGVGVSVGVAVAVGVGVAVFVGVGVGVGGGLTVMMALASSRQPWLSVMVSVTVYTPCVAYVCVGCCVVEIWLSPNCQYQLTMGLLPAVDVSVKYTVSGASPLMGAASKLAWGGALAVM